MIHPQSNVSPGANLSPDTRVWAFATIEDEVTTGPDCVIGSSVYIGRGSRLGIGVRIQHGVFIPRHSSIGNYVFIGPNVTMTDDKYPKVLGPDYNPEPPFIDDHASIGAGAILLPGVRIGRGAMVGAGAVVTHDVPENNAVKGVPASVEMPKCLLS